MENGLNHRIEIPEILINDPTEYATSNKIIATLVIKGRHGVRRMPLIRTKNFKYMTT